jgi:hypothetical protein
MFQRSFKFFHRAEFLDVIQTKVLVESLPPCYSQSPIQLCIEIYISSNSRNLLQLLYIVKEKGGETVTKPYPLRYGLRNPYKNLKSKNSQDYTQKPQRNCTFMNLNSTEASMGRHNHLQLSTLPISFFCVLSNILFSSIDGFEVKAPAMAVITSWGFNCSNIANSDALTRAIQFFSSPRKGNVLEERHVFCCRLIWSTPSSAQAGGIYYIEGRKTKNEV